MPYYSEDDLLDALKECKQKHGRVSITEINQDDDLPSGPTYTYRFDSLADALEEAGLQEEASMARNRARGKKSKPDEELLSVLEDVSKDGTITRKDIRVESDVSPATFRNRFGSLESAAEEIGLELVSSLDRKVRSKNVVVDELESWDNPISYNALKTENGLPSRDEVKYHFDGLKDAAESLDLQLHNYSARSSIESVFDKHYVYVVSFDKDDERCYYVGETFSLLNRLGSHRSDYDNASVEKIVATDSPREDEREMSIEVAREHDTSNVYGGK